MTTTTPPYNEPAFPTPMLVEHKKEGYAEEIRYPGMTLRDWFAGQALAGFMAIEDERTYPKGLDQSLEDWRNEIALNDAEFCYRMADAMLRAREAKPDHPA